MHYRLSIAVALALAAVSNARADLAITTFYTPTVITFDSTLADVNNGSFTGTGMNTAPGAGQLDSDTWQVAGFSDAATTTYGSPYASGGDFGRGTSQSSFTAGVYGWDVDNTAGVNQALGFQPTAAEFTPGSITLRVQNSTGYDALEWNVSYDIFYRDAAAADTRTNSFNFSYSTDGTTFVPTNTFTTPGTSPTGVLWSSVTQTASFLATVATGSDIYFRWTADDVGGSGNRDKLALDNISITAIPEPAAMAFGGLACCFFAVGYYGKGRLYGRTEEESQESVA